MRSVNLVAAALAALCLVPLAARADASAGARMALQWCANCHVVNSSGSGPSAPIPQGPPAFRTIAGRMNPDQLRAFCHARTARCRTLLSPAPRSTI